MKLMISVFKIRSSSFSFVQNKQTHSPLFCPLRNHMTWLLSHQSLSACKDGGYRKYGLKLRRTGYQSVYYCGFRHKTHTVRKIGSISAVSRVRSLILPEERGMSAGSFSRTAAGNRAYQKEHIKLFTKSPNFVLTRPKLSKTL